MGKNTTEVKKKRRKWPWIVLGIIILIILGRNIVFLSGISLLWDRERNDDPFALSEARNYPFHEPSGEILGRKIDCSKLYYYTVESKKGAKIFCSNLYNTTVGDIEKALAGNYDRIVLYGEKIHFDVSAKQKDMDASEIIEATRFTDQITLPNMLSLYGLKDMGYIEKTYSPYPALHIVLESMEETNEGHTSRAGGYAYVYWGNVTDIDSMDTLKPSAKTYYRQGASDKITVHYSWPENCYVSPAMLHELNHNFCMIKKSSNKMSGHFILPNWFDEQVASVAYILFPEYVCGENTITSYDSVIGEREGHSNLIEFNTIMPPANYYNTKENWYETNCQKAIMVQWYRFLAKGDFKTQFNRYATSMRAATKNTNLRDDNDLASFIASLDGTAEARSFLIQNGCKVK